MKIYVNAITFAFKRYLTYPTEILATVLDRVISVFFLIVFWSLIAEASGENLDFRYLASYFLMAEAISAIVMSYDSFYGKNIRHSVKNGTISIFFIRPISIMPYLYFDAVGKNGMKILLAIVSFTLGILISSGIGITNILLFLLYFLSAFVIGFSFNLLEGGLAFIFTEITGIKNAVRHISRILSGKIVPLTFFPLAIRNFVELTPFPHMVFGPINALTSTNTDEVIKGIFISSIWAILSLLLSTYLWKKVIKHYEAIGI